ncbi:AAA family ATPase [Photobacterium swingsii]|uniref:AAA family ATPase n=1 Tax=Photobacterium swingsii TaxID=680026 RepID=UPI004068CE25
MNVEHFDIQVTDAHRPRGKKVTFTGRPLKSSQTSVVKEFAFVTANINDLPMMPVNGQRWRIWGTKTETKVRKFQTRIDISATELEVTMPESSKNFVAFVKEEKEFDGVGEGYAKKLWVEYGSGIYKILEEEDTDKLRVVLKTQRLVDGMLKGWRKYSNLKHLHWLSKHAVPANISSNLVKFHDEHAINLVKDNPYILQSFGMDFSDVDKLAREHFNVTRDDKRRLIAAIEESLYRFSKRDGHTVATPGDLKRVLYRVLNCDKLARQALAAGHENGDFVVDEDGNYHPMPALVMEKVVAHRFRKLAADKDEWGALHDEALSHAMENLAFQLQPKQATAVCSSLVNPISAITGGAGTGKTTVLRVVLRAYQKLGVKIYPMALAGRAAKRIKESTGFHASTIAGFLKNVEIPDDEQAIIVIDEASMVDLQTMYRLVMALHDNVRILLVGDAAQLAPIGYGLILYDVVKSNEIACTELDIVMRQEDSSGIPEFTLAVRDGQIPAFTNPNIRFHHADWHQINDIIVDLYAQDPSNTQILGATKKAGEGGIRSLNHICQSDFNPRGDIVEVEIFGEIKPLNARVNDPVIFVENVWDEDIQNGTMGHLVSSDGKFGVVELDDGRTMELTESLVEIMEPAYAVSLHKAQGSQFPRVIIALTNSTLIDRSWIYTALTRAEKHIEIVGTPEQFERAIKRIGSAERRQTTLHKLLAAV